MRLNASQIEAIKQEAGHFFGARAGVWLFGSRVDDRQRGGDIDLYVRPGTGDAYLDKLNRMEKIGVPPSVDEWLGMREMRQALPHDSPEDSELQVAMLNRAIAAADRFAEILHHAKVFAARYARC